MPDPRLEKLADVLVNYSTAVQPGELVRITGAPITRDRCWSRSIGRCCEPVVIRI